MFDPIGVAIPSSPTNSSVSSSDLDSQSTGSFFHDRSTSLGTLMGVHFPTITFRTPLSSSQSQSQAATSSSLGGGAKKNQRKKMKKKNKSLVLGQATPGKGSRRWWSLCRDDDEAKPGSLAEFLEVERRFGEVGGGFYATDANLDVEAGVMELQNGRGVLFSNGRVLPPVAAAQSPPAVFCGICCTG